MTVITENDDNITEWHESIQILLVLKLRSLDMTALCQKVAEKQKEIISDYERSEATCRYWVKSHLKDGKIRKRESLFELTDLGKWIVQSKVGTIWHRENFINNYTCLKCRPYSTVLLNIDPNTAVTNKKGDIFMDAECPRCHNSMHRHRVADKSFATAEEFLRFYNSAKEDLSKLGIVE